MIAFSGGTPYQIINCINLKYNVLNDKPADLFIHTGGGYVGMKEVAKRIKQLHIFDNVYDYNVFEGYQKSDRVSKGVLGFEKNYVISRLNGAKLDKDLDITKKEYTELYAASGLDFNVLMFIFFGHRNKNFKVYFYDEGVGQYYSKYILYSSRHFAFTSYTDVKKMFKYKSFMPQLTGRFLYEPTLIGFQNFNKLNSLPKIDLKDKNLISIYNKLFNYEESVQFKKCQYLFFNCGLFAEKDVEEELKLLEIMSEFVAIENIVIKFHPSVYECPAVFKKYNTMEIKSTPFELHVMNNINFEEKVLMSLASSAMITPKLVFDLEPEFVAASEWAFKNKMGVFNKVRAMYKDKSKAHITKDEDMFRKVIEQIANKKAKEK